MQSHTALTFIIAITSSDLLMMLPVQWLTSPLTRDVLQTIPVLESLPSPPMCVVRRAGLPLTPAAEYFCDVIRRAALRIDPRRTAKGRNAADATP